MSSKTEIRDKRVELLRFYSQKQYTLEATCKYIGVKKPTAQKYAKMFGIEFSDYKPRKSEW